MNTHLNQTKKKGKRDALKHARKLEKTAAEILEIKLRNNERNLDLRVHEPKSDPIVEAVDELFREWVDVENYPIFCYLDYHRLETFVRRKIL
tara:strand:- start:89 stop:364 length:276 start_codon:yes stop_codon:yes gene_type:complete